MVVAAVIEVSEESIPPLFQFAGLSLFKRSILTAQKAGATTCYVWDRRGQGELQRELQDDPRIVSQIVWGLPEPDARQTGEPEDYFLVCSTDTIFRHPLIQATAKWLTPEKSLVVVDASDTPVLALIPGKQIWQFRKELRQGKNLCERILLAGSDAVPVQVPRGHFLCRLTASTDLVQAEHELLRSLENSHDGFVDTHFNRKLSRPISRWFLRSAITPNQITLLACFFSVLGALCFVPGGYYGPLCGALLLQFSTVLDCCDGEIARVKFMESALGDTLDIVCDMVGAVAIFLGLGVAVWQNGATSHALSLAGLLALGGVLSFPLVTLAEKTEEAGKRRGGWEDTVIDKVLISLTNRDFSILILASALVGQLSWFLWGAAIGAHVFWLLLTWLLFRAGRFALVHRVWEGKDL